LNIEDSFSYWMRSNLKDAYSGLITQDIDFVIFKNEKFFFIEEKNSLNARLGPAQRIIFKMFDDFLKRGEKINNYTFLGTIILYITNNDNKWETIQKNISEKLKNYSKFDIDNETLKKMWDCKSPISTIKTERERSSYRGSLLQKFFFEQKIDFQKIDWIFVNYCSGNFVFLDEINKNKNSGNKEEFRKKINEIFTAANNISTATNPKSGAKYRYLGYYVIEFSNTNPDNSEHILLNEKEIKKLDLINLLNLDVEEISNYK